MNSGKNLKRGFLEEEGYREQSQGLHISPKGSMARATYLGPEDIVSRQGVAER